MPRALLTAACLALALLALLEHRAWRGEQERLRRVLAEEGVADRQPGVLEDLRRETDRLRARQRAARALLAHELDPGSRTVGAGTPPESARRLERARELAESVLASRPAAWQAALVLGGSRYLDLARRADGRLSTAPELWRAPLEAAHRLAPGQPEPPRLLAAAYLSQWTRLGAEDRAALAALLPTVFRDPASFDLLVEPWLRAAPTLSAALAPIPPRPSAWRRVQDLYDGTGDWERFCVAWRHHRDAVRAGHEADLERAAALLRAGDPADGRRLLLRIASESPPGLESAHLLGRLLDLLPPGPTSAAPSFRRWLAWALEECVADACPFDGARLERLAAAGRQTGPEAALVALAAGDPARADLLARRAAPDPDAWGGYHLLRARRELSDGDREAALASLGRVTGPWRRHPRFRWTEAIAHRSLARAAAARAWDAEQWRRSGGSYRLALATGAGSPGLAVRMERVAEGGGAVEARIDGRSLGAFPVIAGETLRLVHRLRPGPHRLQIDVLGGRHAAPGAVELLPAPADSAAAPRRPRPPAPPG